jgi:hypothetical protein
MGGGATGGLGGASGGTAGRTSSATGGASASDAGIATVCTGGPSTSQGCNSIEPAGPCVTTTTSSGAAPAAAGTGGRLVTAGTYVLMSSTLYTGAGGTNHEGARRETLTVGGVAATSFVLNWTTVSGTTTTHMSGEVNLGGTELDYTVTCPEFAAEQVFNFSFDAATNTLTLIDPNAEGGTLVGAYALQTTPADAAGD